VSAPEDLDVVAAAARNNAELCDLVSRAHGIDGEFASDAWTSPRRTPPFYPDAVTLDPDAVAAEVLDRIDTSTGASVKDSFATLDLAPFGFRTLFTAEWILRPSGIPKDPVGGPVWARVVDAARLAEWEAAWTESGDPAGVFRPGLLDASELVVLGGEVDGAIVAGVIANRSARLVGVSNLFGATGDEWSGALDAVSVAFPRLDIVGYESGGMLDAAQRAGFRPIGPLRIWIKD
jgi:hypothetical protein